MLYLFTWNNSYLLQRELITWRDAFKKKYWDENVTHLKSLETTQIQHLQELLLSRSIFSEKRLVVIEDFPYPSHKAFSWASLIEEFILSNLSAIPEDTFVVFSSLNPDKRKASYKKLSKLCEVKNFNISWEEQVFDILIKKYKTTIQDDALRRVIYLKWWDIQKSINEIEKLSIKNTPVTLNRVNEILSAEFEESIFVFIDTLLERKSNTLFSELRNIISSSSIYPVYQWILANLRMFLYIEHLKNQGKSQWEISDVLKLWNRSFLVRKKHNTNFSQLKTLYEHLLKFDKNMKFWKFVSSDEKDLQKELKKIFILFLS